ncbi:MAG: SseB family protein [Acidobacteria bacterium]|nr:SseB family protein [Acidobacteriota bacterium]
MVPASHRERVDARRADGSVLPASRRELRDEILPAALAAFRTDPVRLAETLLTAIEAGLAVEVLDGAEHLARIDPDRRRRTWIPALVSCRAGRFTRAEEMLQRGRDLFGDCADFLYVEAETLFARHLKAKGEAALRSALDSDVNHARALRLVVEHTCDASGETGPMLELERLAKCEAAWRAKLLLASIRFEAGDAGEAKSLAAEAASIEPAEPILGPLSALLARRRDVSGLLELVLPRYDARKHGARCGVNLLYALLDAGRRREGEALIASIREACPDELQDHLEFYAGAFASMESDATGEMVEDGPLRRALAARARHDTESHRNAVASRLLAAPLLVPLNDPVADVPLLELGLPAPRERPLERAGALDSQGRRVSLAFTGEKAIAAWNPKHRHRVALEAKRVLAMAAESGDAALVIDPAGPVSLDLSVEQIGVLLEAGRFSEEPEQASYLVEPLRAALPPAFLRAAATIASDHDSIREMVVFELIDGRRGARPAVGIRFARDADARTKRQIVVDAGDALVLSRGRRRVPPAVVELDDGALLDWLRVHGEPVRKPA